MCRQWLLPDCRCHFNLNAMGAYCKRWYPAFHVLPQASASANERQRLLSCLDSVTNHWDWARGEQHGNSLPELILHCCWWARCKIVCHRHTVLCSLWMKLVVSQGSNGLINSARTTATAPPTMLWRHPILCGYSSEATQRPSVGYARRWCFYKQSCIMCTDILTLISEDQNFMA